MALACPSQRLELLHRKRQGVWRRMGRQTEVCWKVLAHRASFGVARVEEHWHRR